LLAQPQDAGELIRSLLDKTVLTAKGVGQLRSLGL
jgi:hypothetical protein